MSNKDKSLDLVGIGKLAKAIPDSVYEQGTETITSTFIKLVAPITETTSGIGRYIQQKFDNMVDIEKSILTYSIQNAQDRAVEKNLKIGHVATPKNLIKIIEEVSKETDPILNTLWTNLLCSELTNQETHPFFIDILSKLSVKEAQLLNSLNTFNNIGSIKSSTLILPHKITSWVKENNSNVNKWDFSCNLLYEFGLAKTVTPSMHTNGSGTVTLYRTDIGEDFLNAVKN